MTTVLVTGGAGFIGAHACRALAAAGYVPVSYDDLVTGVRDSVRWGPFVEGDVRDRARLESVIRAHAPAVVMHFAALSQVGASVADPAAYWSVNVGGVMTLLEAMRAAGCGRLVFSSTAAVYGDAVIQPIPETAPLAPVNPYGETKRAAEAAIESYAQAYGLRAMRLRYFNACGGSPDAEIGEDHVPETHLMPLAVDAALGLGKPISVFGTDYDTPDGTAIRDYVHVVDLADAHVAAARVLLEGAPGGALNIGTGRGASVREVLAAVERGVGCAVPHLFAPRRAGDPPRLVADPARAEKILSWKARFSLEEAAAHAAAWRRRPSRRDR
jgi:UDP-arabinose 4-epimerase